MVCPGIILCIGGQIIKIKCLFARNNSSETFARPESSYSVKITLNIKKLHQKSNAYYTRGITPKRVSGGPSYRLSARATYCRSEITLHRWRAIASSSSDLTDPGIEPTTSRANSGGVIHNANTPIKTESFFHDYTFPQNRFSCHYQQC